MTKPPIFCCPNCSADLIPAGPAGLCWRCNKPLPPELLKLMPAKPQPPILPGLSPLQRRVLRYIRLIAVILTLCVLTILKGFFGIYLALLLLLIVPILSWSQITTDIRTAKGTATPSLSRWADAQIYCAIAFYLAGPSWSDGPTLYFFSRPNPRTEEGLYNLSLMALLASAVAFSVAVFKFFKARRIPATGG